MSIKQTFTERPFFTSLSKSHQDLFLSDKETQFDIGSYIFAGDIGTGKTHDAVLLMRDYCLHTYPEGYDLSKWNQAPVYCKFNSLQWAIDKILRGSYEEVHTASSLIEESKHANFLILDDLDTIQATQLREQRIIDVIYDIADTRYENKSYTIITTNRSSGELDNFYGKRVMDRFLGLCEVKKFEGESKRRQF